MQNYHARKNVSRIQQSKKTIPQTKTQREKRVNFRRIKENKKQSWRNYISPINLQTPTSVIWKKIKHINRSQLPTNIQFLEINGKAVTQAHDIANTLAKKFQENSNNKNNSSPYFTINNIYIHHDKIDNDSNTLLNSSLTLKEINSILTSTKNPWTR